MPLTRLIFSTRRTESQASPAESYQIMPAAELLSACEVKLLIDLKELIARRGVRVNCSICGEEILDQREMIRDDKMLCRFCASGDYVRFLSAHRKE
jgi:formylmethanofuran dehydrogenase subunit E